jgi:hypothetical protein
LNQVASPGKSMCTRNPQKSTAIGGNIRLKIS